MNTFKQLVSVILIISLLNLLIPIGAFSSEVDFLQEKVIFEEKEVLVQAGTPVILRVVEEVSSKTKHANEQVMLEVARDVMVEGQVVVKTGTRAIATVTWAEESDRLGEPGEVQLSVDSTRAVDGDNVLLRATVTREGKDKKTASIALTVICCILFLLMKGEDATLPIGTEIKAYTMQDYMVTVK